jgi:hypothetical protein
MKISKFIIILLTICLISCNKPDNISLNKDNSSLVIKAGFMCGWGSGEDSLIISSTTIKYVYSVPAKSHVPEINQTRPTTTRDWKNITDAININNFLKLNYNTCNICVDGCDEWISIINDSVSHQVRFGLGFKIDSIKPLQDLLTQFRSEFRK